MRSTDGLRFWNVIWQKKLLAIFFLLSLHKYFNWDSRWFSFSLCPFCYTIGNSIKFTNIEHCGHQRTVLLKHAWCPPSYQSNSYITWPYARLHFTRFVIKNESTNLRFIQQMYFGRFTIICRVKLLLAAYQLSLFCLLAYQQNRLC